MQFIVKFIRWLSLLVLAAIIVVAGWLYVAPPDLIRVGAAYSAKIVCSNVFIAGRDPSQVLQVDVQAPGHPLLRAMSVDVDRDAGTVTAGLLGIFGRMSAMHRDGLGCTSVPGDDVADVAAMGPLPAWRARPDAPWPQGNSVEGSGEAGIQSILADDALVGPGMRAVVVVHGGRIVAERYGEGFSAETPLLGWSMTKTVTAALIGALARDGRIDLDRRALFPSWTDERAEISIAELLSMSSGLAFNEDYGDVTDVTRMLYLESDMAAFAVDQPAVAPHGTKFSYSSGTTTILSRVWQDVFSDPETAANWPRQALFDRIGMVSAVLEPDAAGTYVGSSYLYATGRDWVRFGQLLLDRGQWNGSRVLDPEFVDMMVSPSSANASYGLGHIWLGDAGGDIGTDSFWLRGHDGQTMTLVPSHRLVVLRLGLTPRKLGYSADPLVASIVRAIEGQP